MRSLVPLPILALPALLVLPVLPGMAPPAPTHGPVAVAFDLGSAPLPDAPGDTLLTASDDTLSAPPETLSPTPSEAELGMLARQQSVDELMAILERIDGLLEVEVTVDGRILELSGTALSQDDRVRAGEVAAGVPDIVWVDNRIEVETDLRRRLAPVRDRLTEKADRALRFVPSLLVGLILIGGSFVLAYFAGRWLFPARKGDAAPFHRNLLRQALRGSIGLTGILLALELMDATALVGAVLGAAGVFGIAVGFAFRDIVENYLSGVLLSVRQPFSPRDHVELAGHEGRVVRLTGRETILMTLDGNHVRVPNATVFKSIMTNFSRNPRRRFVVTVGIAPDEAIRPALDAGHTTLEGVPGVLATPAVSARVSGFGDSTVELRFSGWVDQTVADFQKVRSEALKAIKERFEAEGIQTPPPEYGVRILGGGPAEEEASVRDALERRAGPYPGAAPEGAPAHRAEGAPGRSGVDTSAERPPGTPRPASPPEAGTAEPRKAAAAEGAAPEAEPEAAPDISPDTTIEEEIARELRESEDEDLLQR